MRQAELDLIDALVNNAGTLESIPFAEQTHAEMVHIAEVDLMSPIS